MSQAKSPKKVGSIKLEPLRGRFFDIMPAKSGNKKPTLGGKSDFFHFALIAFIAFMVLGIGNAYMHGRQLVAEGQESAYSGYENLKQGMDSLIKQDGEQAMQYFDRAQDAFNELSQSANLLNLQAGELSSQNLYLDTASALVESALEVAEIGQKLSALVQEASELPGIILTGEENFDVMAVVHKKKEDITALLAQSASLQRKLTAPNLSLLPVDLREKIQLAQTQIGTFIAALLEVNQNFDVFMTLLGDEVPHRYLVLFQNNHERRATGGFIGSYMIVDVNDGKITKIEAKDVYETDGQLSDVVKAPAGIDQVADRLYMRDANYSPDFPTSAEQILWFLEHGKGPSADTVIAIDQSLVENLIGLTGSLKLSSIPYQITPENMIDLIAFHTEAKITDSATPKQLLFDLIPAFKESLSQLDDLGALLAVGREMVEQGHLQLYSKDPKVQALSQKLGIAGEMVEPAEKTDYLAVISTSVGGNKSDQYMQTDLRHQTNITSDGNLIDELSIKKTHTWGHAEETKMANMIEQFGTGKLTEEDLYFILGRGPNVDYMRVYVPAGSQIQDVRGMALEAVDVTEDLGYTVFGFTLGPIYPGESRKMSLRYKLPFDLNMSPADDYKLVAWNQAGAENVNLTKTVRTPEALNITETYPAPAEPFELDPVFETKLDRDQTFITTISVRI